MSPKLKTSATLIALCFGTMLAVAQVGCLTPQQRQAMGEYQQQLDSDASVAVDLRAELDKYRAELGKVWDDVAAGKLPIASGKELAGKIMSNISATQQKLADVDKAIAATRQKVDALKASGAPWWAYAIPGALTALQLAGTFVPQLSFLVPVAAALKGQLGATQSKLAVTTEVVGSLSRSLDALPPANAVTSLTKEQLMLEEMSRDELATRADYDEIRRLAQANQI